MIERYKLAAARGMSVQEYTDRLLPILLKEVGHNEDSKDKSKSDDEVQDEVASL